MTPTTPAYNIVSVKRSRGGSRMLYIDRMPDAVPPGMVLVHNHVHPVARRSGTRGSRFWLARPAAQYVACDCGWAAHLPVHHRVARDAVGGAG